jgi:hypothetical protein
LLTQGGAGPSGGDTDHWRHMCVGFKSASRDLCDAIANMAQRVCSKLIDPRPLEAFLANRLLPLDKCPSVHLIGIGEAPRRIISKTIIKSLKSYIQPAAGSMQLCAGQASGELSIDMPSVSSNKKYETSQKACDPIDNSIIRQDIKNSIIHQHRESEIKNLKTSLRKLENEEASSFIST